MLHSPCTGCSGLVAVQPSFSNVGLVTCIDLLQLCSYAPHSSKITAEEAALPMHQSGGMSICQDTCKLLGLQCQLLQVQHFSCHTSFFRCNTSHVTGMYDHVLVQAPASQSATSDPTPRLDPHLLDDANGAHPSSDAALPSVRPTPPPPSRSPGPPGGLADKVRHSLQAGNSLVPSADSVRGATSPKQDSFLELPASQGMPSQGRPHTALQRLHLQHTAADLLTQQISSAGHTRLDSEHAQSQLNPEHEQHSTQIMTATVPLPCPPAAASNAQQPGRPRLLPQPDAEASAAALTQAVSQAQAIATSQAQQMAEDVLSQAQPESSEPQFTSNHESLVDLLKRRQYDRQPQHHHQQQSHHPLQQQQRKPETALGAPQAAGGPYNFEQAIDGKFRALPTDKGLKADSSEGATPSQQPSTAAATVNQQYSRSPDDAATAHGNIVRQADRAEPGALPVGAQHVKVLKAHHLLHDWPQA